MSETKYTPGICNIGTAEIRQRRRVGYIGLILTIIGAIIYFGLVYTIGLDFLFGVLLFIPTEMAAIGFLQARNGFCAAYGFAKKQNVSADFGLTLEVKDLSDQKEDRNKALKIVGQSLLLSVVFSLLIVLGGLIVQGL
jgi:hypothetical protein